ncbi:hypothetical protein QF035_003701 [Streptomyces umbrinus]|uniref:Transposase IS4-like domain-containing protein n=1 Tax=Streptomyces umbrinus TaxID=67370 RepID=A0ABU0SRD1_9ACTN|nr:transposase [Streptomyces umbrinus]MDQ1026119.1 hypothetical protein [Streptomyces umbrinus]
MGAPTPVRRRQLSEGRQQHHLICDGRLTTLKVDTAAANVNDVTQILALVDGIPPVVGRSGRPCRRPDSLLGDKAYDSKPNREELRKRRILPVISRKDALNIKGLGKLRYVVEQTFMLIPGSSVWLSAGYAVPNSTTRSSPSPAGSSAGDDSRRPAHDPVTNSYGSIERR